MNDPDRDTLSGTQSETEHAPLQGRPRGSHQPRPSLHKGAAPYETTIATEHRIDTASPNTADEVAPVIENRPLIVPYVLPATDETTEKVEVVTRKPAWRRAIGLVLGTRWVLAIPAFIIALYAEQLTEQARTGIATQVVKPPLLSWQLFGVAGLLLALAMFPGKALLPAGPSAFLKSVRAMRGRGLFFVLLGGSILCALGALPLFWMLNAPKDGAQMDAVRLNWPVNNGSWVLYIASLVLLALAFIVWERRTTPPLEGTDANPPLDRLPHLLEWAAMLIIFGVAFYLRVQNLDTIPPGMWFDEAQNGIVGRDLVGPNAIHLTFIQDFTQMGALFFYFDGLVVKLFGNHIWVVRILPALSGAVISVLLYVLASRLYGWRAGLAAGGFLAVSSWNITFSRFGMASMPTVVLDVACFLCVAQALRTGRLGYYAGAGVLLGMALQMYYVARLVPLILLALLAHRLITQHIKLVRSIRAGLVVFALGALIAFLPVGLFALQQGEAYNGRPEIVSIFNPANNGGNLQQALQQNIEKHWLMFNWAGDGNGRHNLPGAPMLDWITAALFFAGLASCVLRLWRWQYAFPVIWFVATISGGVLTLPFEAPQSHRALEGSVATALLAGIFAGEVWALLAGADMVGRLATGLRYMRGRISKGTIVTRRPLTWPMRFAWALSAVSLLVVLWLSAAPNYHKYFEVQSQDMGVWKDMYAPQAHAASVSIRYGPDHDVYMAPILKGLPPSVFLAPDVQTLDWPGMQAIPLTTNKTGGVIIILDLPSAADVASIARIYPHAQFEMYTAPSSPEVLIYTISIPTADIQALQGVRVTSGAPGKGSLDKSIFNFTNDTGIVGAANGPLRIAATMRVDTFGQYRFGWNTASGSPGTGQLMVDGYNVTANQPMTMVTGLHSVVVTTTVQSGDQAAHLDWTPPAGAPGPVPMTNLFDAQKIEPHGLTGLFRQGLELTSPPLTGRVDPFISFAFHQTPLPNRPYTGEWTGKVYIPEDGMYVFGTEQLSSSQLFFDGEEIITNNNVNNLMEHQMTLKSGLHDIRLVFRDMENYSHLYLYWTPPGHAHSIIPSAFLWPQMGEYPAVPETGKWPTLDESDGTQLPEDRVTYFPKRYVPTKDTVQDQGQAQPPPPPVINEQPAPAGDPLQPVLTIGDKGTAIGKPHAAAADKEGNIYIFTEVGSKIHKFDPAGKELTSWVVNGAGGAPLIEASALLVKDDILWLLDAQASDMVRFTLDGTEKGRVHLCACFFPRSAALANDGNFWIANTGGGQVYKITPAGEQVEMLGDRGTDPGKFIEPGGIVETPDGTIFVSDIGNKRIQVFGPDHKPQKQWEMGASIARDGNRVAADSKGNVLVTQSEGNAIVRYDKTGKELNRWYFRHNGSIVNPSGIAPLGDDKFIVLYPDGGLAAIFSVK